MNSLIQTPYIWNEKRWYFLSVYYAREKWAELITEIMQYYRKQSGQFITYLFSFSIEKGEHIQVTFVSSGNDNHNYTNDIQTHFQTFVDQYPSVSCAKFPYGKAIWCDYPNNSLDWDRFRLPAYSDQYISFHQQTMRVALKLMEDDFSEDAIFSVGMYLFTKALCCIDIKEQKNTLSQVLQIVSGDSPSTIEEARELINKIDINEVHGAIESCRNENISEKSIELIKWLDETKTLLKIFGFKTLCSLICNVTGLIGLRKLILLELLDSWFNLQNDEN